MKNIGDTYIENKYVKLYLDIRSVCYVDDVN